ncbi:MAG: alpha/beta hydrolase [Alphaproteobacteria bacterium]|nr:alpha/beta hydrolase [Alphaproteobacteria bacterium]MCB9697449.1 alpha/beta hydrolase [Alphaproteobacteria bacterium]
MSAHPIERGGQRGWRHDEGHAAGVFETYDRLDLGGLGPRKVHVLVPRRIDRPLSTLFLHDGDTAFWKGGVAHATWDVAGTLSRLGPEVEPMIVVAVHPLRRDHEYTHAFWGPRRDFGGLPVYASWLAEELKPWIDATYPTNPGRSSVVGSSHGGLASFWAATRHPDAFRAAGCLSPSFFTGLDDLDTNTLSAAPLATSPLVAPVAQLLADGGSRPRMWICWGTERSGGQHNEVVERLAAIRGREMAALLRDRFGYVDGLDLWEVEDEGAGHDEHAWRRRFAWMAKAMFPATGAR